MKVSALLIKENNNLDLMRVVLASLVIVGHSPVLNGVTGFWVDPIGAVFKFTYSGAFAVKLFFFVSGLVVTNSLLIKRSPVYFIISRFFRLIPALFFVLAATVFIIAPILSKQKVFEYFSNFNGWQYLFNNMTFQTEYIIPGIFNNNLYPNVVNGSLWSLKYEIGCYIFLMGGCMVLGCTNKTYLNILLALIIIDSLLPSRFIFSWLGGDNSEIYLLPVSFAFGALYAVNAEKIEVNLKTLLGVSLLYFILRKTSFAEVAFIFLSCNALMYLASHPLMMKLKPKYDLSYGIYLWGFLIQQIVFFYFGSLYVGLHCFIALILSFILAFITHLIIEKPFINMGKLTFNAYKQNKFNLKALLNNS